jgi:hypothetical protein
MNNWNGKLVEHHVCNANGHEPERNWEEVLLDKREKCAGHNLNEQAIFFLSFRHVTAQILGKIDPVYCDPRMVYIVLEYRGENRLARFPATPEI